MARLPLPGGDDGNWGNILNDFLSQVHEADGSLKNSVVTADILAPNSGTDGQVLTLDNTSSGGIKWADPTTSGVATSIVMGGDLSGTSDAANIVAGAVGSSELATGAVGTTKLADNSVTVGKLSPTTAPASGQILTFDGSGLVWSNPASATIPDASITAPKLDTGSGTTGQVLVLDSSAPGGFKWSTLTTGSATPTGPAGGVLAGTYPNPSLASGAVVTTALADSNVTTAKLADASVTTAKLAAGAVTSGTIANGTIQEADLDSAIVTKLNDTPTPQVNSDWTATSGVAQILNKPTIPAQFNPIAGTNVTLSGTYPNITFSATPGAGVTDLSTTTTGTDVTVVSSTGDDATIAGATTTAAGVMVAADKTKLNGIAAGATANQTDAYLLNRANHTGAQAISTVTNLQTSLDNKLDDSQLGAANGVASLDGTGKVPATQLPSYVDDVLEFANQAAFPVTGTAGIIYVAQDTNKVYRWSGSAYIEVSASTAGDPTMGGDMSGTASNAQIVAGAVGTSELADAGVTTDKLADNSVTTAKIVDGTITSADLSSAVTNMLTDDIHNQTATAQSANYWIDGSGRADTSLLTPHVDTPTATALDIGTATASSINIHHPGSTTTNLNATITSVNNGALYLQGTTVSPLTPHKMKIVGALNSSATGHHYGFDNEVTFAPAGASVGNIFGLVNKATLNGSALNIGSLHGSVTGIGTTTGYTGQLSVAYGLNIATPDIQSVNKVPNYYGIGIGPNSANGGNTTGTIQNRQLQVSGITAGAGPGGTVSNTGIALTVPSGSGGTTHNYGLTISGDGDGSSGLNYAIWSISAAPVYFQGNTTIGTTSNPNNYALRVGGTIGSRAEVIQPSTDAAAVLDVRNVAGVSKFAVNTDRSTVSIPKAPSDPAVNNGDMYYNTTSNTFRTCVNGAWQDVAQSGLVSINAQTGTAYTLVLSDQGKLITMMNAAASTVTVPNNATVAFPVGSTLKVAQMEAGQVTFVAAAGVTISADPGLKIATQYSTAELIKTATNTWLLVGRLAA